MGLIATAEQPIKHCRECGDPIYKVESSMAEFVDLCNQCGRCLPKAKREHLDSDYAKPKVKICKNPNCHLAGIAQPIENFHRTNVNGRKNYCRVCESAKDRARYAAKKAQLCAA